MSISDSDLWVEADLYSIKFISNDGSYFKRQLVVPTHTDGEEVRMVFNKSFWNIREIKSLDLVEEVLCLK